MTASRLKFRNSITAAFVLHLLIPGMGHLFWREFFFGIFVFLVTLMAGALFVLSLFIDIPLLAKLIMYGLPLLFYLISFVDLARSVRAKQFRTLHSKRKTIAFFVVGVAFQVLWPVAPVHFGVQNAPDVFIMPGSHFSPLYEKGDLLKASSLAYMVKSFVVSKPIFHSLPDRFSVVRINTPDGARCGIVIGLPGEEVEIVQGVVLVNNSPQLQRSSIERFLIGDWPLTPTSPYSILVAYPQLGRIGKVYDVPLTDLIGKVERLL